MTTGRAPCGGGSTGIHPPAVRGTAHYGPGVLEPVRLRACSHALAARGSGSSKPPEQISNRLSASITRNMQGGQQARAGPLAVDPPAAPGLAGVEPANGPAAHSGLGTFR